MSYTSNYSKLSSFIHVYKEMINQKGEDSILRYIGQDYSVIGVFDGVGGSGAKQYESADFKTGAYLSSRIVANFIINKCKANSFNRTNPQELEKELINELTKFKNKLGDVTSKIKSKLTKELPTTMVIAICTPDKNSDYINIKILWCGDSRCYIVDNEGLHQLTTDDNEIDNPMDNISQDGVMNNIVNLTTDFKIHTREMKMNKPFLIFTATDGCFGYISTPMEFENYLMQAILKSDNILNIENNLNQIFEKHAGDDYSFSGLLYNFKDIEDIKNYYYNRYTQIFKLCNDIKNNNLNIQKIWEKDYGKNYLKFLNNNQMKNSPYRE